MQFQGSAAEDPFSSRRGGRIVILVLTVVLIMAGGFYFLRGDNKQPEQEQKQPQSQSAPSRDTVSPSVTATNIAAGQKISGVFTIGVEASDNQKVTKVELFVDGIFMGVTYAPPFTLVLDTAKLTNGEHTLVLKAYDEAGNVTTSKTLRIMVDNPVESAAAQEGVASNTGAVVPVSASSAGADNSGNGGSTPPPAPDTQTPSVPSNLVLSADDGYTAQLTWTASTDNVGVTGYKIIRGGTQIDTSTTNSYKDQTVVPGNTYDYEVVAYDAAGNLSAGSNEPTVTMAPTTIWIEADTPAVFDTDPGDYELGVKFRPLVNGKVSGIRFYKGIDNIGTHTGRLWEADGTPLANATFGSETVEGWQTVAFATPVDVTAGTTYVASYSAPSGHISATSSYFASAGITSQYLTALASGVEGNNGVFNTTAGSFPATSFSNTNYWVDVTFIPHPSAPGPSPKLADNSKVYSGYPGSNNTGVTIGKRLPVRDRRIDVLKDGVTVKDIEVQAEINVNASNVTIENTRVLPPAGGLIWGVKQLSGETGLTFRDSEVHGDGVNQISYGILDDGSGLSVQRANISRISDGIQANVNVSITDSFVHDLLYFTGDHNDSFLMTGGNGATLTHNTFHNPLNQTAALGLFCDFSAIENVTATNNLLIGGGYSVYGGGGGGSCAGSHDIKFINNRFSKEVWPNGGFNGPVTGFNGAQSGSEWTGNVWHEDGTTVLP